MNIIMKIISWVVGAMLLGTFGILMLVSSPRLVKEMSEGKHKESEPILGI